MLSFLSPDHIFIGGQFENQEVSLTNGVNMVNLFSKKKKKKKKKKNKKKNKHIGILKD